MPDQVDEGSVRPTPDRVREAVFSMLRDVIKESYVLDLFAGSGAHGFEALSRGARYVRFIEKNPAVAGIIEQSIQDLGLEGHAKVEIGDATQLERLFADEPAQIIFVDPPYDLKLEQDFFIALLKLLAPDGVVVYRCFKKEMPAIGERYQILRDRIYGGTRVFVMKAANGPLRKSCP